MEHGDFIARRGGGLEARSRGARVGKATRTMAMGIGVLILGLLYLGQVGQGSAYDYAIAAEDEKIASLEGRRDELNILASKLRSLDDVEKSSVAANMVPVRAE